ncbi:Pectate lyase [Bertholletia excelsa]
MMASAIEGDAVDSDGYWQNRSAEALIVNRQAYHRKPHHVINHLNEHVHKFLSFTSSVKFSKHSSDDHSCEATNPIDQCWRCRGDWAKNRMRLADCVLGFGRNATGGKGGPIYIVTDPSDDDVVNPKPGTLRYGVIRDEPLWIIFARDMVIRLQQELLVNSHKTIDGRGARVFIVGGAGLTLQYVTNVIVHGLYIKNIKSGSGGMIRDSPEHYGFRGQSDGDGVSIFGSSNLWLDHLSMTNCADGLIDAIMGSTGITISNCHFTHHNDVMLLGAHNTDMQDKMMQVTLAFNHFGKGLVQRMPRIRLGLVHVVNNDYTHWLMYAVGGSANPTIISHGNRYLAPKNSFAKEITKREYTEESEWKSWVWKSEGDFFVNGAFFVESGIPDQSKMIELSSLITAKPGSMASTLTRYAGAIHCEVHKPC